MVEYNIVSTTKGDIKGQRRVTRSGKPFFSYQGIPYAKPPCGRLRFQPPEEMDPWDGVKDALIEGGKAAQRNFYTRQLEGSDDCLFLNVYVPHFSASSEIDEDPKAVMVWIHGGGFAEGCGNSKRFGPEYLMEQDVILVTINYRLGVLGFMCLPKAGVHGNMGLKDQVLALKWIQQNIAAFNGDPNRVTLFGESAGAAAVHFHMLSPMSTGLFHFAIAQSGSAISRWAISSHKEERARALGEVLSFGPQEDNELLVTLLDVPAIELVQAGEQALIGEEKTKKPWYVWLPVLETENDPKDAFLTRMPEEILNSGRFNDVPFITGITSHEGIMSLYDIISNLPEGLNAIETSLEKKLPQSIVEKVGKDNVPAIVSKIRNFYFENKPVSEETLLQYVNLSTDTVFLQPLIKTLRIHCNVGKKPVYCYVFSYSGVLNETKLKMRMLHLPGATHADDVAYLFSSLLEVPSNSMEARVIFMFTRLWANFAKTGNPTPPNDIFFDIVWPPYDVETCAYLNIGENLLVNQNFFQDRVDFWDNLTCEI